MPGLVERGKYLMNVMLAITRQWLIPECPTTNDWRDIVIEIYKMEQITAHVNQKVEELWLK